MPKPLFSIALALGLTAAGTAQAQDAASAMVANPSTDAYRLTERGFDDAYGFNDTARAVIHLFYAKWKTGKKIMQYAGVPVPVVSVVGKHYNPDPRTYNVAPNYSSYYYDPWVAPVAFSLLGVSAFGFGKATKWNRRQLYAAIRTYRATRRLPAFVTPQLLALHLAAITGGLAGPGR
ncbi:hypothetical protein ACFST9_06135 [Hymenobacter monticola]|uniref:Uncharacterized protein n=1 Tax=Hymenobacter monticola TaxID=1705399 RepID=A0ABY4BAM0_9BACT|nr:hypothetical protein [Hymenobacter monticola]UOE36198.1 hypothetical protein MTP16_11265 [Hymenobacter monticola]